ncbi:putative ribonuclease H-like domain-containing protein [Tanacetum coccineum]
MCDKKNSVLFTDTGCFVLSTDFKLANESQVLLKVPRKNNMYSIDIKNIVPKESLTCLVAKATLDESMLWHKRLDYVNFKTINKLVKDNLVKGLPIKCFENDQTCVVCLKGKQHKASCKSKIQNSITQLLFMSHMDLFGPTFVSSLINKKYCLVVTDDYCRFTWVFFLASKDETSGIFKSFITQIENLVDKKVKIIRYDNETKFKNRVMCEFCEKKGIKREFSVAKTRQQNGVAKRRNRTLIEAVGTMVLVVKPHNKTPYELFRGRTPSLSFMRPFGCHVTILNTLDHLGKFDGKSNDGFFIGYSLNSKAFRVYNIRTRKVEENLHVRFLEDKPIIAGDGPKWLFDIDVLTKSMNYVPVVAGTNSNDFVGTKESIGAGHSSKEPGSSQDYILMPLWKDGSLFDSSPKNTSNDEPQPSSDAGKKDDESGIDDQEKPKDSSPDVTTAGPNINTASINAGSLNINTASPPVTTAPLEATHVDFFVEPRWIEAMQDELLHFKLQKGYTLEDGIDYDEVFALVSRIEAIRLFLAYASFKDFVVYQMDVKSAFFYGKTEEEVYVCQPLGFEDLEFPIKVYKKDDEIFISQDKYVDEILKKFSFSTLKTASTPMETSKPLLKDAEAKDVDVYLYRSRIRLLMYLTTSRPDILFGESPFDMESYFNSDYAGASLDRKSTKGGCQFLGSRLISWQCKKQTIVANYTTEAEYVAASSCCGQTKHIEIRHHLIRDYNEKKLIQMIKIHTDHNVAYLLTKAFDVGRFQYLIAKANDELQVSVVGLTYFWEQTPLFPSMLAIQAKEGEGSGHSSKPQPPPSTAQPTNEEPILSVTSEPIPNVLDEVIYEEWDDRVERATTTTASLDAEQAISNINRTQSMAIPNVPLPRGIGAGGSPRYQEAMGGSIAQTRSERVPTPPCHSPLPRVHTLGSDEGSMTLQELMVLCTTLSKKVESLEADLKQTKQLYGDACTKLIMKDSEDSSKQGRMIEEINQDAGITLVTLTQGEDQHEDQLGVLNAAKVLANAAKTNIHTYTKRRRVVSTGSDGISTVGASMPVSIAGMVQEVNISIPSPVVVKDKGKGKMEESKDEQTKRTKLQQEQERLEEEWENIRARVEADDELSKRLQVEERNKYNEVDQAKMLVDLITQRNKYFDAQKAKAKSNKPMTQAQQRNYMINYIKHMGSHTLQQLKRYSFDELKELFETTMKNVNTFVPMETEDKGRASEISLRITRRRGKRIVTRGFTTNDDGSSSEEVYVEALHVKYPIIDCEVYTEESRKYWKIIRVGNHTKAYQFFEDMLKIFDRDDLVMLWNLVKERFSLTELTYDKEITLWVELKWLFEPNTDDTLWKL